MADPAGINVDDLRRRARRRLVGAIVLAIAAAVIVPMLLESDPKPLGEDVSIKIPPVDEGRFVNRLNEPKAPAPAATDAAPKKSVADAEKAVMAPSSKAPKYDTAVAPEKTAQMGVPGSTPSSTPAQEPSATTKAEPGSTARNEPPKVEPAKIDPAKIQPPRVDTAKSEPRGEEVSKDDVKPSAPAPKSEARPSASVVAKAEPRPVASPTESPPAGSAPALPREGFAVQLAAFSDDKGANALAGRLKQAGYPAYTEALRTSRGTLWRVRVGPYPSRDVAGGVRDKLKAEGQNGIVAPAH